MAWRTVMQRIDAEGHSSDVIPDYNELPTLYCAAESCRNHENLKKCGRCKSAMYCSTECQRQEWKHHKAQCDLNIQLEAAANITSEPILQRHLRHWTARFEHSLACAVIVGMDIRSNFDNIGRSGMVLHLNPRPRETVGARFFIKKCDIMPMEMFKEIVDALGCGAGLVQHEKERRSLRQRTNGRQDFAAVCVLAVNEGRWKLAEEDEGAMAMRFKPIGIDRAMANSPTFQSTSLRWMETLRMQVDQNMPIRSVVG